MARPIGELEVRAALPLARVSQELRDKCVKIAREKSPSAAFDLGFQAAFLSGESQMEALGYCQGDALAGRNPTGLRGSEV